MFSDIRLQRFRSYRDESFEFDPSVNIIVGPNASGKTNLLEALYVLSTGKSFRAKEGELITHGASWSRIDGRVEGHPRTIKLIPQESGTVKKEFEIHDQHFSRLSLPKTIPVVLFEPNHLQLLHGSPDLRREYLDNLLTQITPQYEKLRRDYRRTLAQRNALLKKGTSAKTQLFAWDVRLSQLGSEIARSREELATEINKKLPDLYANLAHTKTTATILYMSSCDIKQYETNMLHALETRQVIDLERGYTTIGPHREDFSIFFDGRGAAEVASRGETRTILLALKILELSFVEHARDKRPVLLLDDVFSELDGARRKALTEVISGYQAFITTTDADVVVQHFMDNCHIIPMG